MADLDMVAIAREVTRLIDVKSFQHDDDAHTGSAKRATAAGLVGLVAAPAAADSAGTAGTIAYDASYIYVCVAANTWLRAAIATWP